MKKQKLQADNTTPNVIIAHQNRKIEFNHMCPFFGYRIPCLYELKKGKCRALHSEIIRDIFDVQREKYNKEKQVVSEADVESLITICEGREVTKEMMMRYKGLLRNYPAKPNMDDIKKA